MLSISQDIDPVHFDESAIVDLVLEPGEASFHHGWVIHGSRSNSSNELVGSVCRDRLRHRLVSRQPLAYPPSQVVHACHSAISARGRAAH